jgi:hypothetical protein
VHLPVMASAALVSGTGSLEKAVPVLQAPADWPEWERKISNWLSMNGYADLLSRSKERPPQGTLSELDYRIVTETWLSRQERACAIIKNRCGWNADAELKRSDIADALLNTALPEAEQLYPTVTRHLALLKRRYTPTGSAVF